MGYLFKLRSQKEVFVIYGRKGLGGIPGNLVLSTSFLRVSSNYSEQVKGPGKRALKMVKFVLCCYDTKQCNIISKYCAMECWHCNVITEIGIFSSLWNKWYFCCLIYYFFPKVISANSLNPFFTLPITRSITDMELVSLLFFFFNCTHEAFCCCCFFKFFFLYWL